MEDKKWKKLPVCAGDNTEWMRSDSDKRMLRADQNHAPSLCGCRLEIRMKL